MMDGVANALLVVALAMGLAARSEGSEPGGLAPGARVMVSLDDRRFVGTVEAVTADRIVLREGDGLRSVPLGQVGSLKVSGGRKSGAGTGFVVGAIAGAGYAGYRAFNCQSDSGGGCTPGQHVEKAAVDTLLFAGVVGGVGAAIGALFKGERWLEVPLSARVAGRLEVSGSLGAARRGAGARIVLSF
jgi:hypothetical protein